MMLRTTPSRFCSSAARSLRASRRVIAVTITGHAVNGGKTAHPRSISTSTTTRSKHGAVNTSISSSDAHKERYSGQWSKKPFWATAALSTGLVLSTLLTQPLVAEEDNSKKDEANNVSKAAFTKDQIGVICIIGGPSSGKTTQLENAASRFNLIKIDASKQDLRKEIEKIVSENKGKDNNGKKIRVIVEGFPKTLEQSNKFENEVVPILLIISIVLDSSKGIERIKGNNDDDQKKSTDSNESTLKRDANINWKRFEDYSEDLIKRFRYQGNILEITGEWPKDEVWEQVEAKLESALELDDRGEL